MLHSVALDGNNHLPTPLRLAAAAPGVLPVLSLLEAACQAMGYASSSATESGGTASRDLWRTQRVRATGDAGTLPGDAAFHAIGIEFPGGKQRPGISSSSSGSGGNDGDFNMSQRSMASSIASSTGDGGWGETAAPSETWLPRIRHALPSAMFAVRRRLVAARLAAAATSGDLDASHLRCTHTAPGAAAPLPTRGYELRDRYGRVVASAGPVVDSVPAARLLTVVELAEVPRLARYVRVSLMPNAVLTDSSIVVASGCHSPAMRLHSSPLLCTA